ncbi:MAG TPA: DNA polymerase III subunit chi [Steroidobacteraceae bacterium]|nr:DNA polymerase III subunit chi [Steroidobacteraceae bacterium]
MPPRVDFYVSEEAGDSARLRLACRFTEKAYLAKQRVVVFADAALLPRFDEMLWTFGDGSFVPHDTVTSEGSPCEAPVALTTGALPADPFVSADAAVLINLGSSVPPSFEKFARVAEFLDARPEVRTAGRERFKFYRGKSLDPRTHNV